MLTECQPDQLHWKANNVQQEKISVLEFLMRTCCCPPPPPLPIGDHGVGCCWTLVWRCELASGLRGSPRPKSSLGPRGAKPSLRPWTQNNLFAVGFCLNRPATPLGMGLMGLDWRDVGPTLGLKTISRYKYFLLLDI